MESKWRHEFSKNYGVLQLVGKVPFLCDGLVGLVRKKRNYDCFDDQRYNEVDDVEVLAHNVSLVLLQGI